MEANLESKPAEAGLSLLFAAGDRPSADDIAHVLDGDLAGQRVRISHRPDPDEGWVELLMQGLTFNLSGLAPGAPGTVPAMEHQFGISFDPAGYGFQAITLAPGRHIAAGGGMLPVVRTMVSFAVAIGQTLPVKAFCWQPARSWMEPGYFTRIVVNWLSGGGFPALGLTAVVAGEKGAAESAGLRYFTGQEVRVEAVAGEPRAETVQLATRMIDYLVREGPIETLHELRGAAGEPILAEPSHDGRQVRVWRGV